MTSPDNLMPVSVFVMIWACFLGAKETLLFITAISMNLTKARFDFKLDLWTER